MWDGVNGIYWVQTEFTSGGEKYRVYTCDWRMDVDLSCIPDEGVLDYTWFNYNVCGYAGPGYDYHYYSDIVMYKDSNCRIIEVENNFALVDTSGSNRGWTRAWVPLDAVYDGWYYSGMDTYPDYAYELNTGSTEPVGQIVTVWVESGYARSGPGTGYSVVNCITMGDRYYVQDRAMGNTGKDWYQITINGARAWISSGLVKLNGNTEGTAYGIPIITSSDPLENYPLTSTYLVGRTVRIDSYSTNVRQKPDTSSTLVDVVYEYECYEILECRVGSTGKVWYKINYGGGYGWISSGVCTLLSW